MEPFSFADFEEDSQFAVRHFRIETEVHEDPQVTDLLTDELGLLPLDRGPRGSGLGIGVPSVNVRFWASKLVQ